mgnify:CR=1 FL=1
MEGGLNLGGFDIASYASASAGVTVDLSKAGFQDTVSAGTDTLNNFEGLLGSSYDDSLPGYDNDNSRDGGGGNDTTRALLFRQAHYAVIRTTQLEGMHRLQVLTLHPDPVLKPQRQARGLNQRGLAGHFIDAGVLDHLQITFQHDGYSNSSNPYCPDADHHTERTMTSPGGAGIINAIDDYGVRK